MRLRLLLLLVSLVVLLEICSAIRLRASEGTVRVSIFKKGDRAAGGYLVRVLPTDSWEEFLSLAKNRLHVEKICGVEDETGQPVRSFYDVLDNAEIHFSACADGAEPPTPVTLNEASSARPAAADSGLPQVGRPRVPSRLPQPLSRDAPKPLFNQPPAQPGAAARPSPPAFPGAPTHTPINPFASQQPAPPAHAGTPAAPRQPVNPFASGSGAFKAAETPKPPQPSPVFSSFSQPAPPPPPPQPAAQRAMIEFNDAQSKAFGLSWTADTFTGII